MGKTITNIREHNDNVIRTAIKECGGEATVQEVLKRLFFLDEATLTWAICNAPSVKQGGKGLVAR